MRTENSTPARSRKVAPNSASRPAMCNAAWQACVAWLSSVAGAPNSTLMPSPVSRSMVPP